MLFPVFARVSCDTDILLQDCLVFVLSFSLESAVFMLEKFEEEAIDDTLGNFGNH